MNEQRESGAAPFSFWRRVVCAICTFPVLYVLSFGPVMRLYYAGTVSDEALWLVYEPLLRTTSRTPVMYRFMTWYTFHVWRNHGISDWKKSVGAGAL
jgi:hypothetical protein